MPLWPHWDRSANLYLDEGEKYTQVPSGKDVKTGRDPLDFVIKLNQIDTPLERLCIFIGSYLNLNDHNTTLEASYVRTMSFVGLATGLTYGGLYNTNAIRDRFIRKHNAAAFEGQHIAQRKYYDYIFSRVGGRSLKYGVKGALLMTSAGMVSFGSIVYRDKIYAPDWLIGFATVGALSRFMLGPKAWLFGAGMGLVAGSIGLVSAYGIEFLTGMSTAQMRYLNHTEWLHGREFQHNKILMSYADFIAKQYSEIEDPASAGKF